MFGWLGGVVVSVSDSWSRGCRFDSRPLHYQVTILGKLFTPICLCHQAVQFGTGQRMVMLWGREDNCRSGVALAMWHRLLWFIHLLAHGHQEGDEHPTYAPNWSMVHFFYVSSLIRMSGQYFVWLTFNYKYIQKMSVVCMCAKTVSYTVVLAWWAQTAWSKSVRAGAAGRVSVTASCHRLPVSGGLHCSAI